jgi:hypothetical protein
VLDDFIFELALSLIPKLIFAIGRPTGLIPKLESTLTYLVFTNCHRSLLFKSTPLPPDNGEEDSKGRSRAGRDAYKSGPMIQSVGLRPVPTATPFRRQTRCFIERYSHD